MSEIVPKTFAVTLIEKEQRFLVWDYVHEFFVLVTYCTVSRVQRVVVREISNAQLARPWARQCDASQPLKRDSEFLVRLVRRDLLR